MVSAAATEYFLWGAQLGNEIMVRQLISKGLVPNIDCRDENGWTALLHAAANNHCGIASFLIEKGACLEPRNYQGVTPLHVAADQGHMEAVKLLVNAGADINSIGLGELTPLLTASLRKHSNVAWFLIEKGASLESRNNEGETALMQAVLNNHYGIVASLFDRGACLESRNDKGETALLIAATNNHYGIVAFLIGRGACLESRNKYGTTALFAATYKGHMKAVELLVSAGADINSIGQDELTPLLAASMRGHSNVASFLIKKGAALDVVPSNKQSALHFAVQNDDMAVLQALMKRNTSVLLRDLNGETALMQACRTNKLGPVATILEALKDQNNLEIVRVVLETPNSAGSTPLLVAAVSGFLEIVKLIAGCDANINAKNEKDDSPLLSAMNSGHVDVVRYLIGIGADIEQRSWNGSTPLMNAAMWGLVDMVEILLDAGADWHTTNFNGATLLVVAAKSGHLHIVKKLVELGADLKTPTNDGGTAFSVAVMEQHTALIKYLADQGADMGAGHHNGMTALSMACQSGDLETCSLLIDFLDARGNMSLLAEPDMDGCTALHHAIRAGDLSIVQLLVHHGADINMADFSKKTPLYLAIFEFQVAIAEYLIKQEAAAFNIPSEMWTLEALEELHDWRFGSNEQRVGSYPRWFIDPKNIQYFRDFDKELLFMSLQHNADSKVKLRDIVTKARTGTWLGAPVSILEAWFIKIPIFQNKRDRKARISVERFRVSFSQEVSRWYPLNHPHVLKLYGACHRNDQLLLVYERVNGGNLHFPLRHHRDKIWKILYEAALAVQYLHERGIVHGHIMCENILLTEDNSAKLDGLGNKLVRGEDTEPTMVWKSPEVAINNLKPLKSDDVYSLGMCIIEAITGEAPYAKERRHQLDVRKLIDQGTLPSRQRGFSDQAWDLVKWMCSSHRSERLKIADVVRKLGTFATEEASASSYSRAPASLLHRLGPRDNSAIVANVEERLAMIVSLTGKGDGEGDGLELERQASKRLQDLWLSTSLAVGGVLKCAAQRYDAMLSRLVDDLKSYNIDSNDMSRRYLERRRADAMFSLHTEIDRLARLMQVEDKLSKEIHEWRQSWNSHRVDRVQRLEATLTDAELEKLENRPDHVEVLTCLYFEITRHRMSYTPIQPRIFHAACQRIKQLPGVQVDDWFLPPYEVTFDDKTKFSFGSFGSVHTGTWMNSRVVVKKVRVRDPVAFEREVGIWFLLFHPHVVQLYGACHVAGKQFFVCELAANGRLDTYLYNLGVRRQRVVWQRLYEAAIALLYLHHMGILHRDLKCDNILVGSDGTTRLADFGLSSVVDNDSDSKTHATAAIRWKAHEIVRGGAASTASDVYGLAMCIVQALTNDVPWRTHIDSAVRIFLRDGEVIDRPEGFNDAHWDLVRRTTSADPADRMLLPQVVEILLEFAEQERNGMKDPDLEQDKLKSECDSSSKSPNDTLSEESMSRGSDQSSS